MEAWRHGGMEAWRHGGMEAWRHGAALERCCLKRCRMSFFESYPTGSMDNPRDRSSKAVWETSLPVTV
jgi:hypothetical protein